VNCIVTAGPTYEALDEVRRLTNFSTGRLGSELVNFLTGRGHQVTLLIGQAATWRGERNATDVQTFTTTDDLLERLRKLSAPDVQAVFHAAAVNDFKFGNVWQGIPGERMRRVRANKIPTRSENLLVELRPTAKVIAELRGFFPKAVLVGWKFEVDGSQKAAIEKAERQIAENNTNACVANGAAYGEGFGIVTGKGKVAHCETLKELFAGLERLLGVKE
jgi:phosphopantothenoylcysteine decarboxylase/phosphopantothenate--cysteine ligase